jgi:hypothetical protein
LWRPWSWFPRGGSQIVFRERSGEVERLTARGDVEPVSLTVGPERQYLLEYQVPMLNRELDEARVRAILEFLWRADHGPGTGMGNTDGH